jgi:hypothetical protein
MSATDQPIVAVAAFGHPQRDGLRRSAMAGANGAPTGMLGRWEDLAPNPRTRCLLVHEAELGAALERLPGLPAARLVVLASDITDAMLAASLREERLVAFIADGEGLRLWEVSFLVRRLTHPSAAPPMAGDLLQWGSATVSWKPKSTDDRDRTVEAVEVVAARFGLSRRSASSAAEASHELLMNAMYDAPVDEAGRALYAADRQAKITLAEREVPTLRLTVDHTHLALDIADPFGRMPRNKLYGGLLRGRRGAHTQASVIDASHGGAGLGLFKLQTSAVLFGVAVSPGKLTLVSWVRDHEAAPSQQRALPRTLYFLQGA